MKRCFLVLFGLIIGGLLASAQCYTDCSIGAVSALETGAMTHCHEHSQSSGQPKSACLHHDFRLFSPEKVPNPAALTQSVIFPAPAASAVPEPVFAVPAHERWIKPDPAPPPNSRAFLSLSILRI